MLQNSSNGLDFFERYDIIVYVYLSEKSSKEKTKK